MRPDFWDTMHSDFDDVVFDPVASDVQGAFWKAVDRYGKGAKRIADFGCGTGRQLPRLSQDCDEVVGLDFAPKLLAVARARLGEDSPVQLRRADLRKRVPGLRNIDFAVCVNALIMTKIEDRRAMLRTLRSALRPGAKLVMIVPSLEGALYVNERLIEWNRRSGLRGRALLREGIAASAESARDLLLGVIDLAGSPTKHFLREEALCEFRDAGFHLAPEALRKGDAEARIEYPWSAYFEKAPRWLTAPLPWDWLFVLQRGK